jgi:hypothetical protein
MGGFESPITQPRVPREYSSSLWNTDSIFSRGQQFGSVGSKIGEQVVLVKNTSFKRTGISGDLTQDSLVNVRVA